MLDALPLVFVLIGLVLYTVLAGADFGAGMWQLMSGGGERGERIRDHCHHSMGPVWEANHVWLIFVLTVTWTAYPVFFGSVASTLAVALFIAALGIILRGASYALRSGAAGTRELRTIDGMFAVASLVTPFALGAAAGGIAAERVPVGNAAGNLITSWLNPTSILIGLLAVAFSAYLAAVYLAADAARRGETELVEAFRVRALGAGAAAGGLALAGLIVVHADDHSAVHGSRPRRRARGPDPVGRGGNDDDGAQRGASVRAGSLHGRARRGARRRGLGVRAVADASPGPDDRPGRRPARHDGGGRGGGRWRAPSCCSPPWLSCSPSLCEATSEPTAGRPSRWRPPVRAASPSCSWDRRSEPGSRWRC